MSNAIIEFHELSIPADYGKAIHRIFYVIENGRSSVMENFQRLDPNTRDDVKDLICRMATMRTLRSPKVKYTLKGYNYGEIRPMPHRFFFFQKCGNNIIFFEYLLKKRDSFRDTVYNEIHKKKERYATAFEQFIQERP
jgi:hypothetical protein